VQALSVLLFIIGAAAAGMVAVRTAEQLVDGTALRLRVAGTRHMEWTAVKYSETIVVLLIAVLPVLGLGAYALRDMPRGIIMIKLLACAGMNAVFFYGCAHGIARVCRSAHVAALVVFSLMILLLFAGGGFYPLHWFGGPVQAIGAQTPAGLNTSAVLWASGGAFPFAYLLYIGASAALAFGGSFDG